MMEITECAALNNNVTLQLKGRLDIHARKIFFITIDHALITNPNHLTLDFTNVTFMDSSGLGMLMLAKRKFQDPDHQLTLVVPEGNVKDVMNVCLMEQQFSFSEA